MDTIVRSLVDSKNAPVSEKWSSLTGIVTAICGNILISFALNTQRYAHLRLSREREEQQEKQKQVRVNRQRKSTSRYGTQQQSDVAEQRAKANRAASPERYEVLSHDGAGEQEPLIPRVEVGKASPGHSDGEAEVDEEDDRAPKERSYLRSPIWWLGITLMTVGEAGNFLAYGFAPASIVSPMGVVALVSNCLIAPLLLHEKFRWRDGVGVIIAVAGCVTVVLSATSSNPKLTPDAIWDLITQWEFETYLGVTIFLITVLTVASNKFGERTILIDLGLVGLFGGYTALSTKGVASLLTYTIWRVVTFPVTYLLVAVLVFTAVMQIKYLNRALQRFNATMVIPTQFVMFTLSVIIGSAVLYRDFERTTPEDAGKFIGGCALTFLGVWCITSGRQSEVEQDEEMGLEDEDGIDLVDEEGVQPEVRERGDYFNRRSSVIAVGSSNPPPFPRYHSTGDLDGALQSSLPRSSVDGNQGLQASLAPANLSAIHPDSTSILVTQPDDEETSRPLNPPPMHATTSAPQIPTLDLRPKTPLRRGVTGPAADRLPPTTPNNQFLDPNASPRLSTRHSVAFFPAPYTSPLSSSLSAIVADSLRRGTDSQYPSLRPGKRKPDGAPPKRHSIASGEMDFGTLGVGNGRDSLGGSRARSLSATLGDIFRSSKRQRTESGGRADDAIEEVEGGSEADAADSRR